MAHISDKNLFGMFNRFCVAAEIPITPASLSETRVGTYHLEHLYTQGWRVTKIVNEGGGETDPFGSTLRNKTEMYYALHFAACVLEAKEAKLL